MALRGPTLVLLGLLVGLTTSTVRLSNLPKSSTLSVDPSTMCKTIKFVDASRKTDVREAVLRALCVQGIKHVLLDATVKQFAVFNIHRDHFDAEPKWHSGDAQDVAGDPTWSVNEVVPLTSSGYKWYRWGYPIWPLPSQAVVDSSAPAKGLAPLLGRKKSADWPNYGFATPLYFASKAWRNQAWSLEEFFQQEKKKSLFKNHKELHKLTKAMAEVVDGNRVESYSEWPFLKYSLVPMVKSAVVRAKGLCPDEVYIYTRMTPCHPVESEPLKCVMAPTSARTMLTEAGCRTTDVITGYTEEYTNNNAI